MEIGSYIRHFLYRDRGEHVYRYGIIIDKIELPHPPLANIFWHVVPNSFYIKNNSRYEIIKIHLLELVSEPG